MMKNNIFKIVLLIILLSTYNYICASENVEFTASAPKTVAVGEAFQLVYTLNTSGKDLRLPSLEGFEILAGPFTSTSSSMQYVNGNMSTTKTVRYTYTLNAVKVGEFAINSATITVSKNKVHSNSLNIKVIAAEDKATQTTHQGQTQPTKNNEGVNLSSDNLYIRAIPSRTKVKEQEAILLTYKIYSRVDLVDIQSVKFPELKGLLVQEIDENKNIQADRENINGKLYVTYQIKQYLIFSQKSGKIEIPEFTCDAIVRLRQQKRSRSIFDDFFDSYQDVSKSLKSNKVTLNVDPLPPTNISDYSGAVGKFNMKAELTTNELKAHESLTLKVIISGVGNLKLVKNPTVKFPADFETYEPKVSNNFKTTSSGISGSKTIEYLAIPRHNGKFIIPAINLTYFDTEKNQYLTLSSEVFDVNVLKGDDSESTMSIKAMPNQESVKMLASDIRYINTRSCQLEQRKEIFAGTFMFWLIHVLSLFVALVLLVIFRKQVKESANIALMRTKKANKVAKQRLKIAKAEMEKSQAKVNKDVFYDEILKALWGYLCDKFSIPLSLLNKENVEIELSKRSVSNDKIEMFIKLLNDCELERYAPQADSSSSMDKIYNSTIMVISELENSIKK